MNNSIQCVWFEWFLLFAWINHLINVYQCNTYSVKTNVMHMNALEPVVGVRKWKMPISANNKNSKTIAVEQCRDRKMKTNNSNSCLYSFAFQLFCWLENLIWLAKHTGTFCTLSQFTQQAYSWKSFPCLGHCKFLSRLQHTSFTLESEAFC